MLEDKEAGHLVQGVNVRQWLLLISVGVFLQVFTVDECQPCRGPC